MATLEKAVLINYDKLKSMIESNTVDEDTTYFLPGKEIINTIQNIEVPSIEGLAKTIDIENKLKDYVRIDKIVATDITKTPDFIGQVAVSYGSIYIAESTEGPGAWRIVQLQPNDHL